MNEDHNIKIPHFSKEWLGVVGAVLLLAQLVLIILSWLLSATRLEGVRSLLSSEGIRWFVGDFSTILGMAAPDADCIGGAPEEWGGIIIHHPLFTLYLSR